MKYILIIFISVFASKFVNAQTLIPNAGFELWEEIDTLKLNHELPKNWKNIYTDSLFLLNQKGIIRKSDQSKIGIFCTEMRIDSSNQNFDHDILYNTFPFKGRPQSLQFFSRFDKSGNSATIEINLYKLDSNGNWIVMSNGTKTIGFTNNQWELQAVQLYYNDSGISSRAEIKIIYPSNSISQKNISFFIDEISFSQKSNLETIDLIPTFELYPNPNHGMINIINWKDGDINIYNVHGVLVKNIQAIPSAQNTINLDLPNGTYYIKNKYYTKSIIIINE